jgi:hypothetical protein
VLVLAMHEMPADPDALGSGWTTVSLEQVRSGAEPQINED